MKWILVIFMLNTGSGEHYPISVLKTFDSENQCVTDIPDYVPLVPTTDWIACIEVKNFDHHENSFLYQYGTKKVEK